MMPPILVLRVRGTIDVRGEVEETLERLNLRRRYNATIIPDTPDYMGMLHKVKDYVAWHPVTREILVELLRRRARVGGWRPLTEEMVRDHGFSGIEELADSIVEGRVHLHEVKWLKPYFALHPPRGGFKGPVKRQHSYRGVLGRNPELPTIVARML